MRLGKPGYISDISDRDFVGIIISTYLSTTFILSRVFCFLVALSDYGSGYQAQKEFVELALYIKLIALRHRLANLIACIYWSHDILVVWIHRCKTVGTVNLPAKRGVRKSSLV